MILQVFNSSIVSGPETLVLPAISQYTNEFRVLFLKESRFKENLQLDPKQYAKTLGLNSDEITVNTRFDFSAIKNLAYEIKNINPDIIHAHDVKASVYVGLAVLYLRYILNIKKVFRLVTTHHGVGGRYNLKLQLYEKFYCSFASIFFDRILTVSTHDYEHLKKLWFLPINKLKLHLNGATRKLLSASDKLYLRNFYLNEWSKSLNLNLSPNDFYLGIVGRLSPEKNHLKVLNIFSQLIKSLRFHHTQISIKLLIIGSGDLESMLKKTVAEFGLSDRIIFLGYQTNMESKMAALDILLSFSDFEGISIAMIESGWARTPVFANDVGGNSDLISSPDIGILCPSSDTLEEIVNKLIDLILNHQNIDRLGESFQNHVKTFFSQEMWFRRLKEIYHDLLR